MAPLVGLSIAKVTSSVSRVQDKAICQDLQILALTVAVLIDPKYAAGYLSINTEIIILYAIVALTILYCVLSTAVAAASSKRTESCVSSTNLLLAVSDLRKVPNNDSRLSTPSPFSACPCRHLARQVPRAAHTGAPVVIQTFTQETPVYYHQ